ncbi:DUF1501 domain-containing protein [Salibaculum sp.]|uniref:DUF1501 domain-containing protein n=1 Tax=Salibaculum sp. TaxID=2855480 RepID=UPI002B48DC28|nr:DUF1501 domain-containing protein [Salibaculum sp.]HKL70648.1 DUF1501 domain-containing protein [Salibaculum sp.]
MSLSRRDVLIRSLALGCSAAAAPLVTPVALANAPWEGRLVVIILRGALDGLDAIRPHGDADFAALRPTLGGGDDPSGLDLDGFFTLHPGFESLHPLWQAGEFGAVHAVSTPYRDKRSHFDGQDILEAGLPGLGGGGLRDGWLNRMLQLRGGLEPEIAYAIGRERMLVLSGLAETARWSPEADLAVSAQARQLLNIVHHDDPLFRDASADAIEIAASLELEAERAEQTGAMMQADPMMAGVAVNTTHVQLADFAASRLRGDTRIASFSINGWDTHSQQDQGLRRRGGMLSDTILALRAGLGDVWGRTAVLCLTEFGRTAAENGSGGTDHGTGGAMLFAGGALRGGQVLGDWPGLAEADLYDRRDLMPTRDLRAHAAWVMAQMIGLNRDELEQVIFPGLEMGARPGLLL